MLSVPFVDTTPAPLHLYLGCLMSIDTAPYIRPGQVYNRARQASIALFCILYSSGNQFTITRNLSSTSGCLPVLFGLALLGMNSIPQGCCSGTAAQPGPAPAPSSPEPAPDPDGKWKWEILREFWPSLRTRPL